MYCRKCGKEIDDNAKFCPGCGESTVVEQQKNTVTDENITKRNSKKALWIGLAVAAIVLIVFVVGRANESKLRVNDQLTLGNRYLSELDYEKAIAAYKAVIEIDPKNVDAYIGLADAYIGLDDAEQAVRILEVALSETGDERIQEYLQRLKDEPVLAEQNNAGENGLDDADTNQNTNMWEEVTEAERESGEDAVKEQFKNFFISNYSMDDIVYLADVTHDGVQDMIVIQQEDEQFYGGYVYTCDDSEIKMIYEIHGGTDHAGGFFNWYIIQRDSGWNLAEEFFGMWQGMGEESFDEYYLTNMGERINVDSITCPESDSDVDAEGYVKDDAFSRYVAKLNDRIPNYYCLFVSWSEASATPKSLDTTPRTVFDLSNADSSSVEESVKDSLNEYLNTLIEKEGTIETSVTYPHHYIIDDGFPRFPSLDNSISGIGNYKVADFDGDGQDELLIVKIANGKVLCDIYEYKNGTVGLSTDTVIEDGWLRLRDRQNYAVYLKEYNGNIYIIENGNGLSHGYVSYCEVDIWRYTGTSIQEDDVYLDEGEGYYIDEVDWEDEVARATNLLRKYGLNDSADDVDVYEMNLKPDRDGLETLFGMKVSNSIPGGQSDLEKYMQTSNVSYLGTLNATFYR